MSDPTVPPGEVDEDVFIFYRTKVLFREVNKEIVKTFRTQIVNSEFLHPLVSKVCSNFIRTGDLSVTEEDIRGAKKDLRKKTLRVEPELTQLWDLWYGHMCDTIRATEDKLPTINR